MVKRFLAVLVSVATLGVPVVAHADNITFKVRSYSRYAVEVAFHSQNRKHVWPAPGRSYIVKDYDVKNFNLTCVRGERICYGATIQGNTRTYWGVSANGGKACQGCCYTCSGNTATPVINLNER